MKIHLASMMTESNTFSHIPTTRHSFDTCRGRDALAADNMLSGYLRHFVARATSLGIELDIGLCAVAQPSAPIMQSDYESLRDELLASLRRSMPLDAVFLLLHGAMVSEECLDCEGDILERVREVVGREVPVLAVLDPHAHLSERMLGLADVLAFMKEYPHTDGPERIDDLFRIVQAMWRGEARPTPAVADCRVIGLWPTQTQPIRDFTDRLAELEKRDGILSISFVHGFPWGDTPDTGSRILVYGNGDTAAASSLASQLAGEVWQMRDASQPRLASIDEALDEVEAATAGPLVLADIADNAGGGAPSDSTFILVEAIKRGIRGIAFALFYDPPLVKWCHRAGIGAHAKVLVGGKLSPYSGAPVELDLVVKGLARDSRQMAFGKTPDPMGDTAWVQAGGVDLIISSLRTQCFDPVAFSHLGLDPKSRRALVVKSTNHFQAGFAPIARRIIAVATPGALSVDFANLAYRAFNKPYWPRDNLVQS